MDLKRNRAVNSLKMEDLFSNTKFKKAWRKLVFENDPVLHKSGDSALSLLLSVERIEEKMNQLDVDFHSFFMPDISNEDQSFYKRYFQHVTWLKDNSGYVEFGRDSDPKKPV